MDRLAERWRRWHLGPRGLTRPGQQVRALRMPEAAEHQSQEGRHERSGHLEGWTPGKLGQYS